MSNLGFKYQNTMEARNLDFSNKVDDQTIYDLLFDNYELLGKDWIAHQWIWINGVYKAFEDHVKFFIVVSLVEKTLNFYHQVNITKTYDEFYSSKYLTIDKFSITEICEKLNLPKETIRRKVLELEKLGVILRKDKRIIIDRSAFTFVKPIHQIPLTSKYIVRISELLFDKKIYSKKFDSKFVEKILKKNFSLCWRWFYRMQLPVIMGYQKIFKDLCTFHIWGTISMNQVLNYKINSNELIKDYNKFNSNLLSIENLNNASGVSAMSISDMTSIPRATVIRKCKFLIKNDYVVINNKKQFYLSSKNHHKIIPFQKEFFKKKARFLTRVLNLIAIS